MTVLSCFPQPAHLRVRPQAPQRERGCCHSRDTLKCQIHFTHASKRSDRLLSTCGTQLLPLMKLLLFTCCPWVFVFALKWKLPPFSWQTQASVAFQRDSPLQSVVKWEKKKPGFRQWWPLLREKTTLRCQMSAALMRRCAAAGTSSARQWSFTLQAAGGGGRSSRLIRSPGAADGTRFTVAPSDMCLGL